jgi:hypothetical protein
MIGSDMQLGAFSLPGPLLYARSFQFDTYFL